MAACRKAATGAFLASRQAVSRAIGGSCNNVASSCSTSASLWTNATVQNAGWAGRPSLAAALGAVAAAGAAAAFALHRDAASSNGSVLDGLVLQAQGEAAQPAARSPEEKLAALEAWLAAQGIDTRHFQVRRSAIDPEAGFGVFATDKLATDIRHSWWRRAFGAALQRSVGNRPCICGICRVAWLRYGHCSRNKPQRASSPSPRPTASCFQLFASPPVHHFTPPQHCTPRFSPRLVTLNSQPNWQRCLVPTHAHWRTLRRRLDQGSRLPWRRRRLPPVRRPHRRLCAARPPAVRLVRHPVRPRAGGRAHAGDAAACGGAGEGAGVAVRALDRRAAAAVRVKKLFE